MLTLSQFLSELERRRATGATQQQLADELCVSQQAVQQWLSLATTPSKQVLRIADRVWRAPLDLADGLPGR